MIITYHGGQFIKVQQGETIVAANPFSKTSQWKPVRFGAHIGLISVNHPDYNGIENLSHGDKVPFIISGPGEYEVGGITIVGLLAPRPYGPNGLFNTIYTIDLEGVHLCLLGALSSSELPSEIIESIGEVDILFTPISGGDILSPSDAEKIAVLLGAKIVIPLSHEGENDKQLKAFLRESGAEDVHVIEKLTLKKKDLEGKEGDVIVLGPVAHA